MKTHALSVPRTKNLHSVYATFPRFSVIVGSPLDQGKIGSSTIIGKSSTTRFKFEYVIINND